MPSKKIDPELLAKLKEYDALITEREAIWERLRQCKEKLLRPENIGRYVFDSNLYCISRNPSTNNIEIVVDKTPMEIEMPIVDPRMHTSKDFISEIKSKLAAYAAAEADSLEIGGRIEKLEKSLVHIRPCRYVIGFRMYKIGRNNSGELKLTFELIDGVID